MEQRIGLMRLAGVKPMGTEYKPYEEVPDCRKTTFPDTESGLPFDEHMRMLQKRLALQHALSRLVLPVLIVGTVVYCVLLAMGIIGPK